MKVFFVWIFFKWKFLLLLRDVFRCVLKFGVHIFVFGSFTFFKNTNFITKNTVMDFSKTTNVILLQFWMLVNIFNKSDLCLTSYHKNFLSCLNEVWASSTEEFFVFLSFSIFFLLLLSPTLFQPNSSLVNTTTRAYFYHHNYDNIIIFDLEIYKLALYDSWLIKLMHLEIMAI